MAAMDESDGAASLQAEAPPMPAQTLTVYLAHGDSRTINLEGMRTFEDIKHALVESSVPMDERSVLVDDQDNIKDFSLPLHNNVPGVGLAVKVQVQLAVVHANLQWAAPILLNSKSTIQSVKNLLGPTFSGVRLTWRGQPVSDDLRTDQLPDLQLLASDDPADDDARAELRLVGHLAVSVLDLDLGESGAVELTGLGDDTPLKRVLELYQEKLRRPHLHEVLVSAYVEGETSAESMQVMPNLNLHETLYESRLGPQPTIAIKTAMFEVVVKEQSEIDAAAANQKGKGGLDARVQKPTDSVAGLRVLVFDWWSVKRLKDAYAALVTDGLGPADQLFLEAPPAGAPMWQDELGDDKTLFYYQIQPDTTLLVKREDFTATYCYYICADCGNDVKLKQRDHVRCRECGHRIVFKRRIAKPCQYQCR